MNFLFAFGVTFVLCWVSVPILLVFLAAINFYTTVTEGRAQNGMFCSDVFSEWYLSRAPFPLAAVRAASRTRSILRPSARDDTRLDQELLAQQHCQYRRGHADGFGRVVRNAGQASRGIPVLRMWISWIVAGECRPTRRYGNLSNLPLQEMLEKPAFHEPNRTRRGFTKGRRVGVSNRFCLRRKVHFRDNLMIRQIEQKVVNRLRQVTSAIRQRERIRWISLPVLPNDRLRRSSPRPGQFGLR